MQPGLSEKGMVKNAVLVDCLERAALVNYPEVFKLFVSHAQDKHAKIVACELGTGHYPYLHPPVSSEDNVPLSPTLMLDLIQRCIDYMYELHDYYIDVSVTLPTSWFPAHTSLVP